MVGQSRTYRGGRKQRKGKTGRVQGKTQPLRHTDDSLLLTRPASQQRHRKGHSAPTGQSPLWKHHPRHTKVCVANLLHASQSNLSSRQLRQTITISVTPESIGTNGRIGQACPPDDSTSPHRSLPRTPLCSLGPTGLQKDCTSGSPHQGSGTGSEMLSEPGLCSLLLVPMWSPDHRVMLGKVLTLKSVTRASGSHSWPPCLRFYMGGGNGQRHWLVLNTDSFFLRVVIPTNTPNTAHTASPSGPDTSIMSDLEIQKARGRMCVVPHKHLQIWMPVEIEGLESSPHGYQEIAARNYTHSTYTCIHVCITDAHIHTHATSHTHAQLLLVT